MNTKSYTGRINFRLSALLLVVGLLLFGCEKKAISPNNEEETKEEIELPTNEEEEEETNQISERGFSQNEKGEEIVMPNEVVFARQDINSKIVSLDEEGNLIVKSSEMIEDMKVGDILYSLPTEMFPDGYALKVVEPTSLKASTLRASKAADEELLCTQPATIDEVFETYKCDVQYKVDTDPSHAIIYDIADQQDNPLGTGLFGKIDWDEAFSMKSKLDVWNNKALTTNPSNTRLKKIKITDKEATIEYVIFDMDDNLKTDKDQVILELTVGYDLSNTHVFADGESGTFAVSGLHTWKAEGTLKYSPKADLTDKDKKAYEKEMNKKMVGKKFTIASIRLTPLSATNLIIKPTFDLFYELTADVNGKIAVTGGVKDYQYSFSLFASAALAEVQKEIHVVKSGTFYADIEVSFSSTIGLAFGMGLTCEIPAFRMFETRKKSYFGLYADYGVEAKVKVSQTGGSNPETDCFNFDITYDAEPSIYAEYAINFTSKYSYSGKVSVPLNVFRIEDGKLVEYEHCWKSDIPKENLVAYYPFDGNANDMSGQGNHGELLGGTTLTADRNGRANSAYNFGGYNNPSAIRIIDNNSLHFTDQFTVSAWYKLNGLDGMNGLGYYSENGIHCVIAKDGDRGGFCIYTHSIGIHNSSYLGSDYNAEIPETSPVGEWVHIAAVVSPNSVEIFQNGQSMEKNTYDAVTITEANNRDLYIGRFGIMGGWYPLNGDIDDIRIYNRALTTAEVQALYHE
jgi:hypothetical protein